MSLSERGRQAYARRGKNRLIPPGSQEELTTFITYRISLRAIRRLAELKRKLGFRSYESVIVHLMNVAEREGLIPIASAEKLRADSRPTVITGEPGCGKTLLAKSQLQEDQEESVLIIDVADEYELPRLGLAELFAMRWQAGGLRYRFVPNPNLEISRAEASAIFSHLNLIKQEGSLRHWMIIVEEAHRFTEDRNFNALIAEARKFIGKLILITSDWRPWEGRAIIYKPPPLDTLLQQVKLREQRSI